MLDVGTQTPIEAVWDRLLRVEEEHEELYPSVAKDDPMDVTDAEYLAFLEGKRQAFVEVLEICRDEDIPYHIEELLQRLDGSPLNVEVCD